MPGKRKAERRRRGRQNGRVHPAKVNESKLLDELLAFIGRFVVMTDQQRLLVALWVMQTHLVDHCEQAPYLSITSPEKQCGKSRVLETLEYLVARPWRVISPSDAVAYRYIHAKKPTLLLDEVDQVFAVNTRHPGLVAILNAGHRRGAKVARAKDFGKGIEEFDCFCAKALAGIGTLPDTVADRSIYIRLERKDKGQRVQRLIRRDVEGPAAALRERVAAWAAEHGQAVGAARPFMPPQLSDRMEEGCEALVAIAERLGCADLARDALVHLLTVERLDAQQTMRQRLLRDLRDIWREEEATKERPVRAFHTDTLLHRLHSKDDSPWRNYYGRMLEANDLAALLRHYGVHSKLVNIGGKRLRGYRRDAIQPVVKKYVDDDKSGNGGSGGNG